VTERVVVCFRQRGAAGDRAQLVAALQRIVRRADALGGRIVAWHAAGLAIDFAADAIDDAIELVTEDGSHGKRSLVPAGLSVGIAQGRVDDLLALGARAALASGCGLERAEALAQVARAKEVLLDPAIDAVRGESLLTSGSRRGLLGKRRVRGLRLDSKRPFRADAAASVARIVEPRRLGSAPPLPAQPGALSIVFGPSGAGGSRALADFAPRAALRLTPVLGEPLGALRAALEQERAGELELDAEHAASLESLLTGEGLDLEATLAAVASWLERRGGDPLITIDDLGHVDADSIEAMAQLCARGQIALVVRHAGSLPSSLAELPIGASLDLVPLPLAAGAALASAFVAGTLAESAAGRWARRGSGLPLAIREALIEALESGELIDAAGTLGPRVRSGGRGRAQPAAHWIARRARFVVGSERRVLDSMAVVGQTVSIATLSQLLAAQEEGGVPLASLERSLASLFERRWLLRDGERISLPSATHRHTLARALEGSRRSRLHRAGLKLFAKSPGPLCAVAAATHALLAGDLDGALPLARRGAAACQAAGMSSTAEALNRFTETGDPELFTARGLLGGACTDRAGLQSSDVPPAPSVAPPSGIAARRRRTSGAPRTAELLGPDSTEPELAARMAEVLKPGNLQAADALLAELRSDRARPELADRMDVMLRVARGQVGDALRISRQLKARAAQLGAAERSRAALAHAIALAAAGRNSEALLEALDGLARAREGGDRQGERACARFLARLSQIAGHDEAAERWSALATG
jgi:hypothetical protein